MDNLEGKCYAELQKMLQEAHARKATPEVSRIIAELLRPEAREAIAQAKKNKTTKDGYGVILGIIPSIKPYQNQFFQALAMEGYPADTLDSLREMFS